MKNNFERELPIGYKEVFHIDARNKKTGLILNLIAIIPLVIMAAILFSTVKDFSFMISTDNILLYLLRILSILGAIIVYMILHELVHGIVYKALTKEKLTFGVSWSCAFCGVPNVYVYRKTAILALIAPFAVFTALLLPLTIVFSFFNSYLYIFFGVVFAVHFGGCSGDLYMFIVLSFRYKNKALLMRDTGPEQWLYIPDEHYKK